MVTKKTRRVSPGDKKKNALKASLKRGRQINLGLGLFSILLFGFVGIAYVLPRFSIADGALERGILWLSMCVIALVAAFMTLKKPRLVCILMLALSLAGFLADLLVMNHLFGDSSYGFIPSSPGSIFGRYYDNRIYLKIFYVILGVSTALWLVSTIVAFWRSKKAIEFEELFNSNNKEETVPHLQE